MMLYIEGGALNNMNWIIYREGDGDIYTGRESNIEMERVIYSDGGMAFREVNCKSYHSPICKIDFFPVYYFPL